MVGWAAWQLSSHPIYFITAPQQDTAENQKSKSKKNLLSVLVVKTKTACYMSKKLEQTKKPTTKTQTKNPKNKCQKQHFQFCFKIFLSLDDSQLSIP